MQKQKMSPKTPIMITVNQAIELSGMGRTTINKLIRNQQLTSITVGRRRLIKSASLDTLLSEGGITK